MTPVRRAARALSVDRATAAGIAARALSLLAGPVTLVLIARTFSPALQGYYYTFGSLVAMQTFFELGLYIVVVNVASHEWSLLHRGEDGRVAGDPEAARRLGTLLRILVRWYAVAAGLFLLVAAGVGWRFLSADATHDHSVPWQAPWMALVALSAVVLFVLPLKSLLEACGQVAAVSAYRAGGVVATALAAWTTMIGGGGLWALVASAIAGLATDALLLARYRALFLSLWQQPRAVTFAWRTDVWPMQWRLAIQGVLFYFAYSILTPVMFRYHGAVVAGQMGMTWQLAMALQSIGGVWLAARVPAFGVLIARREFDALDTLWRRVSIVSMIVTAASACALSAVVWWLGWVGQPLASRALPLRATALLMAGMVASQGVQCLAVYLRAHKRDPLALWGVAVSVLAGTSVYTLGRAFGAIGAVGAYAVVMSAVNLPAVWWIWRRSRREWHRPVEATA